MQAAPARYVSVSELYSADEVELLLEEIRELEPTSCRGEELQDFEIAGSGAGGRSPAGSTERSWDSHAHYSRAPPPPPRPLAPLYCRLRHLATLQGAVSLFVLVCCACALGCVWGGAGLRAALLPLAGRVRALQLAALTSLLLHAAQLVVHVSGLSDLMPIDWNKLAAWAGAWSCVSLAGGGAGAGAALLLAPEYRPAPAPLRALLLTAAGFGLAGGLAASSVTVALTRAGLPRAAYRAVPSTSRDHAL